MPMIEVLLAVVFGLVLTLVLPIVAFLYASAVRVRVIEIERRLARLERWMLGEAPPDARGQPDAGAGGGAGSTAPTAPAPPTPASAAPASPAPAPAPPIAPPHARPAPLRLETRIGTRWMLYAGVATLVVGVGLFVRYAFVNQWLTEPLRVVAGVLAGGLLIVSGRRFTARGHARFGTTLAGGGVAAWYLAAYAALNLYRLVDAATGFSMLVAVTAFAAFQADRLRAQPLAMMAVLGGFATPFLVGGGADAQTVLFTYAALLVGAIVYLAHRRDWPALTLASFVLTGLTVSVWYVRFYEPGAWLRTELFLTLYAALFLWVLHRSRESTGPYARVTRWALATTPLWYHAASLSLLGDHWLAFLVYLIAVTGAGVAIAARANAMWARLGLWVLVAGPLLGWTGADQDGSWLAPAVVTWIAIAGLHAAAQLELLRRRGGRLHPADVVFVPVNGFGLAFGLQAVMEPHLPAATGLVTALLAVAWWGVARGVRRIETGAAMHVLVLAAALAVAAIGLQLDGAWGPLACAAQAGGLAWVGIRERRAWIRAAGAGLLAAAVLLAMAAQAAPVPAAHDVFVNRRALLGLFVVGVLAFVAWLHRRADRDVPHRGPALAAAVVGANALLLFTLSMEIRAFWELRRGIAANAELAMQMMLSATWAAYAAALTAAGIRRRYAPIRYLAIVVFGATVLKVFLVDFSQLDSVYRIASSVVLGLLLLAASYLYQRQSEHAAGAGDAPAAPVAPTLPPPPTAPPAGPSAPEAPPAAGPSAPPSPHGMPAPDAPASPAAPSPPGAHRPSAPEPPPAAGPSAPPSPHGMPAPDAPASPAAPSPPRAPRPSTPPSP